MSTTPSSTSPQARRDALRLISYGLYVLTTARGTTAHAITFNWLTQISFEPLLVAAAVENASHTRGLLAETGAFAVNFLGADQVALARRTAAPYKMNPHKLAGLAHHPGVTGAPVLAEAIGHIECQIRQTVETGGDHVLFVAEVVAGEVGRDQPPLTLRESRLRYK